MNVDYATMDIMSTSDSINTGLTKLSCQIKQLTQRADLEERRADRFHKALMLVGKDLKHLREFAPADTVYQLDAVIEIIEEALYS